MNNHIHARGLAPIAGTPEDPVTGSMQAGLATYVLLHNIISNSLGKLLVEQGHFISRPGFVEIDIPKSPADSLIVTGQAVHVFSSEISL